MNLDSNGLPVQADGDANDQLQRVGMIVVGAALGGNDSVLPQQLVVDCFAALVPGGELTPEKNVYRRNSAANPNTCSADQLIPVIAHRAIHKLPVPRRLFAQNTHTIEGKRKLLPDLLFLRAAPLYFRHSVLRYLFDLLLPMMAYFATGKVWKDDQGFADRSPDDVDDANGIITMAVCHDINPTPMSKYACRLYARRRPTNFGVTKLGAQNNIQGALEWYNRAESGGNPELAALYKPIVERVFYGA